MRRRMITAEELAELLKAKLEIEVVYWDVADDGTFKGVIVSDV